MKRFLLFVTMILWASSAYAANWYVDNSVSSNGNGQSWATAWKALSNITGLSAGDTVYISGGSTSQTYSVDSWQPINGSSGKPITYAAGQDSGHNGTVIFYGGTDWLGAGSIQNVIIDGNYGGANHMSVQNYGWYVWAPTASLANVTLRHIDFPNMSAGFHFNDVSASHIEFDHLMIQKVGGANMTDDVVFALDGDGYDAHLIHDCTIYYPVKSSDPGWGDDVIKWGSGISFYNNYVKAVYSNYTYTQHSDIFQIADSYYKIYNNVFEDVGESIVFFDRYTSAGKFTGLLFYNNLAVNTTAPGNPQSARALDLLAESTANGTTATDFIVANNTFVDWTQGAFLIRYSNFTTCTNCYVANNIYKNCNIGSSLQSGVASYNNTSGSIQFVKYSLYGGHTNDLHLAAGDSVAINQGKTLSNIGTAFFNLDKNGVSRPQDSAWDIGAYQYATGSSVLKPVGPLNLRIIN